jgi:hypothetical protein
MKMKKLRVFLAGIFDWLAANSGSQRRAKKY